MAMGLSTYLSIHPCISMLGALRLSPGIIPDTKGIFLAALWYRSLSSFLPFATSLRADEVFRLFPHVRSGPLASSGEDKPCLALCGWSPCLFPWARIRPACFLGRGQALCSSVPMEFSSFFGRGLGLHASSAEDKRMRTPLARPACFLGRGQAFFLSRLLPQARTSLFLFV